MPARLNEQHRSAGGEASHRRGGPPFPHIFPLRFAISFRHPLMWIIDDEQIHGAARHSASDTCGENPTSAARQLPFILLASTEFDGETQLRR